MSNKYKHTCLSIIVNIAKALLFVKQESIRFNTVISVQFLSTLSDHLPKDQCLRTVVIAGDACNLQTKIIHPLPVISKTFDISAGKRQKLQKPFECE